MQKKSLTKTKVGGREITPTSQPAKLNPSREEIARRAYEIYVARGQTGGRELEDWVQAERELSSRTHRNN